MNLQMQFEVIFVLYLCSVWVVSKHKKRQAGLCFILRGGMCPTGRSIVLYEMALFAFLNL